MKLVQRLIYDRVNPFEGPQLTSELEKIEEEIEQKALDEHNEQVKKHYKKHIENGENVELVNMDGKLFISHITKDTERFRKILDIINAPFKDIKDIDERIKIQDKYYKLRIGELKPKTKEELYIELIEREASFRDN